MTENCPMRHENGNCIPAGGFCTANKNICEALLNAYKMGKAQLFREGTTKDTTSDLISRQQAIDECNKRGAEHIGYAISNLPSAQPEPQEGHWIPRESPDGGEQYECSRCGVLWEFNDGTPEDNEAYFCPKCGKKLITK